MDTTKTNVGHSPNKVDTQPKPKQPQSKNVVAAEPSVFGNNFGEFMEFLKETWIEFRKISWPNRQEVIKETWSVIVLCALITCAVLAFDWAVSKAVFEPLDKYAKRVGGGVGHTTQTWGPMAPQPGVPTNNPNIPGNAPMTPPFSPQTPAAPAGPAPAAPTSSTPAAPTSSAPATSTPASPAAPGAPSSPATPSKP